MSIVYLLFGGNLGNRFQLLRQAYVLLCERVGNPLAISSIYETQAWGIEEQPDFLNQVVAFQTIHNATKILKQIQEIETELGRKRNEHWGARTMDIDILFYNNEIINQSPSLIVPHPLIQQRRFVLVPLAEIAANFIHPVLQVNIKQLLNQCPDEQKVKLYQKS